MMVTHARHSYSPLVTLGEHKPKSIIENGPMIIVFMYTRIPLEMLGVVFGNSALLQLSTLMKL